MFRRFAIAGLLVSGCVGGAIMGEGLVGATQFGTEVSYAKLDSSAKDGGRTDTFTQDFTARYGIVTSTLQSRCKSNELCETPRPHIEFGPAGGAGLGITGDFDLGVHAYAGGFIDYRERSAEDRAGSFARRSNATCSRATLKARRSSR